LGEAAEVVALGQILTQQLVGVLVDATLPGAVRIGEVNFHPGGLAEALMGGHFATLIISQGETFLGFNAVEHMTKTVQGCFSAGIVHFGQHP